MSTITPPLTTDGPGPHAPWARAGSAALQVAAASAGVLIAAGFLARLLAAWYSIGTNDAVIWAHFAERIRADGLLELYRTQKLFNHPPLPAYWAALCGVVADATGVSFWFLFKLPGVAADALACALLWRVWSARAGPAWGRVAAVAFAWNLDALLVTGYHCNTDPVYAALVLLAAHLIAARGNFLAGGLALAAAINVKIIPVFLIPTLASLCRDRRDLTRFFAGLAVGVVPFLPPLLFATRAFLGNVLGYNSFPERWGVGYFLGEAQLWGAAQNRREFYEGAKFWLDGYRAAARYVIIAAVLAVGLVSWRRRRWDAYELAAITLGLFLALTPGFGVQYTVMIVPALLAVSLRRGTSYGLLAGLALLLVYWAYWTGTVPLESDFTSTGLPMPGALFGLLAWWGLLGFLAHALFRPGGAEVVGPPGRVLAPAGVPNAPGAGDKDAKSPGRPVKKVRPRD